ncbi:MAG: fluoride efflux transporter CrcB [Calditrichaeota bacterium]|nr:MAG: fluoride efflux transporter CrcB [Calditrichota bacterium]
MWRILIVGAGGFVGAVLRYAVSGWVHRLVPAVFPFGTLTVNVVGSFCLGLLMSMAETWVIAPGLRVFLTVGLLGAFTTFSTFSYETMVLFQERSFLLGFLNIAVSLILGLAAALAGLIVGRML